MKSGKFWIAVLVGGIVANILDFIVQGLVLNNVYYAQMPELFNTGTSLIWYIIGDFVAVFVFAWVYDKVAGSFEGGPKGGMMCGLYAGILVNFPTWIFMHLFIKGFPYGLSWISTIYGIVWYIIIGAILAGLYKKGAAVQLA